MNPDKERQQIIKKLDDSPDLVDIMVSIEDYLDTSNMYVFKNWIDGELVEGPFVEPYWVRVAFKWPYLHMPDPQGGLRLTQHGTKLFYKLTYENVPQPIHKPSDYEPGTHKPKIKPEKVWVVEMLIPRRFIDEVDDKVLDLYDADTDMDSIQNVNTMTDDDVDGADMQSANDGIDDIDQIGNNNAAT